MTRWLAPINLPVLPDPGFAKTLFNNHSACSPAPPKTPRSNPLGTALVITDTFSSPLDPIGPYAESGSETFLDRSSSSRALKGSSDSAPRVAFLDAIV